MSKSSNFDSALSSNREVYVLSKQKNRFQERGNGRHVGDEKLSPNASVHLLELLRFELFRRNKSMEGEHIFALAAILITLFSINRLDNLAFNGLADLRSCELSLSVIYAMLTIFFMVAGLSALVFIAKMYYDGCSILRSGADHYKHESLKEFDGYWEETRTGRFRVRKFIGIIAVCYVLSLCIHPELWCDNWELGLGTIFILLFAYLFFCFLLWAPPCWCSCESCCYQNGEFSCMRRFQEANEKTRRLDEYWRSNVENSSSPREKKIQMRRPPLRENRARQSIELKVNQKQMITIGVGEPYSSHTVEIMSPHAKLSKRQTSQHVYEHHLQEYQTDEEIDTRQSETVSPRDYAKDWYHENDQERRLMNNRSREREVNNLERESVVIYSDEPIPSKEPRVVSFENEHGDRGFERYENLDKRKVGILRDHHLPRGKSSGASGESFL